MLILIRTIVNRRDTYHSAKMELNSKIPFPDLDVIMRWLSIFNVLISACKWRKLLSIVTKRVSLLADAIIYECGKHSVNKICSFLEAPAPLTEQKYGLTYITLNVTITLNRMLNLYETDLEQQEPEVKHIADKMKE